jgi:7-carboxy-7-deazaguanine synthase
MDSTVAIEGKTLVINEIFHSIQGESTYAGRPCVFVRLTACDLRCSYCDTEYAFYEGQKRTVDSVLHEVSKYPQTSIVEITGGEPLLQANVHDLMQRLLDEGRTVLIETSGAHEIASCDPRVIRIVDFKCPSSGEMHRNRWENVGHLKSSDEVKFVIGDRFDFDWSEQMVREFRIDERCTVLFSPVWQKLPNAQLAQWVRDSKLSIRFQLQLHKILWGLTRGV